jgi:2'-5' RNA ligase
MARHYVGVALLLPRPIARDLDAFRRGLGAPTDRVPPHVTLLNGQYLSDAELDDAIAHVRAVAADTSNLHLVIGPAQTFHPLTPVVYLGVSGPGAEQIEPLRDALNTGVLALPAPEYPFVPHVTLSMDATPDQITGALAAVGHYREVAAIDAITMLELGDDETWRPIADAAFGAATTSRTLGADAVTIAVTKYATHVGSTMGRYRPVSAEAFVDGRVVAIAHGRVASGAVAWLDELVVVAEQRGSGIGAALGRAFVDAARAAGATEVRSARGATVAGFLVKLGFVPEDAQEFVIRFDG